ncbi:MAG: hypothetical protein ACK5PP_01155 [Acidimicrobiales bacterium]
MLLWYAIVAPVLVAEIFRSPMLDYRLVALGAVLPLGEVVYGQPLLLHTLLGPVLALGLVMGLTMRRRLLRRRWLGIPIGMFMHLVLDGSWTDRISFWWPAFGFSLTGVPLPEQRMSTALGIVLELAALAIGWWAWRRYELGDPANRQLLLRTGHLARGTV